MPKFLARLARAEHHPGVAVLRRLDTGETIRQLPMTQAYDLMGRRKEVFYYVTQNLLGDYHIGNEVPPEEVEDVQAKLLDRESASRPAGSSPTVEGS